jgi:beta-1,4-mannosyl-glycoprotein beta-1,4-N-acetylglucosaminyltransferase
MNVLRGTRRKTLRYFGGAVCLLFALLIWSIWRHESTKNHYLSLDLQHFVSNLAAADKVLLSPQDANTICTSHKFATYRAKPRRKVFDLVLLSTELDWLEIRLNTLSAYVDYFVIVESPTTFTGKSKPLHLQENWHLFQEFHHQIIHRVVEDPIQSARIWDHEDFFRNSLLHAVFPALVGTEQEARHGDVLVISDMDEIVRPGTALVLRYCDIPARLTLRTDFYYYSFQWRHRGLQWAHPDATIYQGAYTLPPNDLRAGLLGPNIGGVAMAALRRWWDRGTLWNAGWHCSSCFASVAEMRTKMHSFSHQGWNTPDNREAAVMMDRVRNGQDLFGRPSEIYDRIDDNQDVPAYIRQQYAEKGRFKYMLDRDGEDAGFEDWNTTTNHDQ